jgi:hypothetical protein
LWKGTKKVDCGKEQKSLAFFCLFFVPQTRPWNTVAWQHAARAYGQWPVKSFIQTFQFFRNFLSGLGGNTPDASRRIG